MKPSRISSLLILLCVAAPGPLARSGAPPAKAVVAAAQSATELRPRAIECPAPEGSGQPFLAVAPDGAVWLSWIERQSESRRLMVAKLAGAKPVARVIAAGPDLVVNGADAPCLVAMGGAKLAAAWGIRRGEGEVSDLQLAVSANGGSKWSSPVMPHHDGTQALHGFSRLARDGDGVRAVWLDARNGQGKEEGDFDMTLRTARLSATGVCGADQQLDARTCDCCPTAIATTAHGTLVAYRDRSAEEIRDIAVVAVTGDRPAEPHLVHADAWKIPGCPVNGPALAVAGEHVALAWFTGAGEQAQVNVAFSSDGGRTFGAPARVDEGHPIGRVDVALLADGAAAVSWLESKDPGVALRLRRVGADGVAAPAVTVADLAGLKGVGMPRMVRAGSRLLLAWTEPGTNPRVRMAEAAQ